jgi:hypothetical protein
MMKEVTPLGDDDDAVVEARLARKAFGDPCHEFEHSIVFFVLTGLFAVLLGCYVFLLFKRYSFPFGSVVNVNPSLISRRSHLRGHDIICLLLLTTVVIRMGPKLWGALQVGDRSQL